MHPGMVIIGAGETGARAAFTLREQGWTGSITLIGTEVHAPYERPPLSKSALTEAGAPFPKFVAQAAQFADAGIETLFGVPVAAIDRPARLVRLEDGRERAWHKLLLATGALPRRLPLPGADSRHCLTLRSFEDAVALRACFRPGVSIAIIGGGFIGLELAASARANGAEVTLIEALPRILSRGVPVAVAEAVEARHRRAGVGFHIGTGLSAITETASGIEIALTDGTRVAADRLIIGIGAVPETGLAAAAGLAVDNGIAVDGALRTSDPDIHAAGDCCSFPIPLYGARRIRLESWRNAQDQGAHAARAMLGQADAFDAVPWFWSDQYDLTLQVSGLVDEANTTVRRDLGDDAFLMFHLGTDGRLVAASGIGPGNAVARDIRLAEMLIARRASPDPAALADPARKLKGLLAA